MQTLADIANVLASMPQASLTTVIILASFALAAYAIYAMRSLVGPKDKL